MEIYFGDDAPTLEEQGLDLFVDCKKYQKQIDEITSAFATGGISLEELEKQLDALAVSISQEIDEVLGGADKECTLIFDAPDTIH
jgi:hypothetical protein